MMNQREMDHVIDCRSISLELHSSFGTNTMEHCFHTLCSRFACLSSQNELQLSVASQIIQILLDALEIFLTNSDNPTEVFESLKHSDHKAVCGEDIRKGDAKYKCHGCAKSPLCVLCSECFEKSQHKNHNYEKKIHDSDGAAFCDCGVKSVWKSNYACEVHGGSSTYESSEKGLPLEMISKAEYLYEIVLKYCYQVLTLDGKLPEHLRQLSPMDSSLDIYHTLLYTDTVDRKDQLMTAITAIRQCSQDEAIEIIKDFDKNGRMSICKGNNLQCCEKENLIKEQTKTYKEEPIKVKVVHHTVVAHQEVAYSLLQWLQKTIKCSDGLRSIFCRVLFQPFKATEPLTFLENFLLADIKLWKAMREQYKQLYMAAVFTDDERRLQFAKIFTKHYPILYREHLRDSHCDISAMDLVSQIYTVEFLAISLIRENKLIDVILQTMKSEINNSEDPSFILSKIYAALGHLRNCVEAGFQNVTWTEELNAIFLDGFRLYVDFLSLFQNTDPQKRLQNLDLQEDAVLDWRDAFYLHRQLSLCTKGYIEVCKSDPAVLIQSYKIVLQLLVNVGEMRHVDITIFGQTAECCDYEVGGPRESVSLHLPLHRLLVELNHALPDEVTFTHECFAPLNKDLKLCDILDYPLRIQVLLAQVKIGMWNENKVSLLNQLHYYQYKVDRHRMYDRDIQLMQAVASIMDPNNFIINILHKFGLSSIFQDPKQELTDPLQLQAKKLLTCCLQLIIVVLGERFVEEIGQVERNEIILREIIHKLVRKEMSEQALKEFTKSLGSENFSLDQEAGLVELEKSDEGDKEVYKVKLRALTLYNPCFYRFDDRKRSKANLNLGLNKLKTAFHQGLHIPEMPRWRKNYASISLIFFSSVMAQLLKFVLEDKEMIARPHIAKVLHIITMGLHEDKQNIEQGAKTTPFIAMMKENRLEPLLIAQIYKMHILPMPLFQFHGDLCRFVLEYFTLMSNIENKEDLEQIKRLLQFGNTSCSLVKKENSSWISDDCIENESGRIENNPNGNTINQPLDPSNIPDIINLKIQKCAENIKMMHGKKDVYNMTLGKRGRCIIINNKTFTDDGKFKLEQRKGSEIDVENLENVFKQLNFDVHTFENFTRDEMLACVDQEVKHEDHVKYGVFVLVIMTHGSYDTTLYGADSKPIRRCVILEKIYSENFTAMQGKPKLVIIQACEGDFTVGEHPSDSALLHSDTHPSPVNRKSYLNRDHTCILRSSADGFRCIRHATIGSFFIRAFVESLYKHSHDSCWKCICKETENRVNEYYSVFTDGRSKYNQKPTIDDCLDMQLYLFPGFDG